MSEDSSALSADPWDSCRSEIVQFTPLVAVVGFERSYRVPCRLRKWPGAQAFLFAAITDAKGMCWECLQFSCQCVASLKLLLSSQVSGVGCN
jgi:hypothetical protein